VRGEATAPAPESEPREERERPTRAQTGTGPRGAALDARCRKIVGDTGITMRIPRRRAGEQCSLQASLSRKGAAVGVSAETSIGLGGMPPPVGAGGGGPLTLVVAGW
jgi:hypothetical protein